MGEVYRARDTRLDRSVAIKVLNSALSATPDLKARFEREAKAISQLNHPNICVLHDVGSEVPVFEGETPAPHDGESSSSPTSDSDQKIDFLVMEFLDGESLADRIKNKGALPLSELIRIGCEIADALDKAHRAGIVHRDLKPGNVMLTRSGAKLLDFGLAKPAVTGTSTRIASAPLLSAAMTMTSPGPPNSPLTQHGVLVGTVQYMSPEQIQGMEADARSDIFALGAVLYEMGTGKRAFEGKSQLKVASSILEDEPQPVNLQQKTAPAGLAHLIRACLAKDPDQRLQSALDVKLALLWLGEVAATPVADRTARRWKQLLPWIAFSASLLAGVALFIFRPAPAPARRMVAYLTPPGDFTFDVMGDRGAPPVVSPDGMKLAFGAGGKLWLRQLDQDHPRELDGTDGASFPFWSPDSKSIGFFQAGKLRTMDVQGGTIATVCDAQDGRGGSWSAAGFILFAPTVSSAILKVPASGGTPTPVSSLKAGITTHRWPQVLPGGKRFLYFAASHANSGGSDDTGIYAGSTDGGESILLLHVPVSGMFAGGKLLFLRGTTLMEQGLETRHARLEGEPRPVASGVGYDLGVWRGTFSVADNGVLVYSGGDPGSHHLQWFGSNGQPEKEMAEAGHYAPTALSPKGSRLAAANDPQGDLWVVDLNGGGRIRITDGRSANPVWSPDERQLAYLRFESGGSWRMVVRSSDGTGTERVLDPEPATQMPSDWSPDGKHILYDRGDTGTSQIWAVAAEPGGKPFPVVQTGAWDRGAHFSPDGKWIVFTSRESGADQVYVTPFPGPGPKWQVSAHGGDGPRWSADGKWICFWNAAHNILFKVSVSPGGGRPVFGAEMPFINGAVYVSSGYRPDYSLSRDGRALVNRVGEQSARFTIVTSWEEGVGK
jgi:serine/threonine protein kinase